MEHDLETAWEEHTRQEFETKDPTAALRTMTTSPTVVHVPVMTGGVGLSEVRDFYSRCFVGQTPVDFSVTAVSRTVGYSSLVDEFICCFTHDVSMDWMLPGIAPTDLKVALAVVAIVEFENGLISQERIYWDHASLLSQIGLIDPTGLPITGANGAKHIAMLAQRDRPLLER